MLPAYQCVLWLGIRRDAAALLLAPFQPLPLLLGIEWLQAAEVVSSRL